MTYYSCAKYHCRSVFSFGVRRGVKMTPLDPPYSLTFQKTRFTLVPCSPQVAVETYQAEQENPLLSHIRKTHQNMLYIFIGIIKSKIVQI